MSKKLRYLYNRACTTAYVFISAIFMFVPEDFFKCGFISCEWSETAIIVVNRLVLSFLVLFLVNILYFLWRNKRQSVEIVDKNYIIRVEYGDILKIRNGKKVINFDECYTTTIGNRPEEIKPQSICGQYLQKYPIDDIQGLTNAAGIQPTGKSKYKEFASFDSGTIIPRDDFFLMAFAKLDQQGRGTMTYSMYLECLDRLWHEIDLYHGADDVYVPILGSRITRFDNELTQQELLDVMISSYRLSPFKMKNPSILHIVCRERDGFSLNDVIGVE